MTENQTASLGQKSSRVWHACRTRYCHIVPERLVSSLDKTGEHARQVAEFRRRSLRAGGAGGMNAEHVGVGLAGRLDDARRRRLSTLRHHGGGWLCSCRSRYITASACGDGVPVDGRPQCRTHVVLGRRTEHRIRRRWHVTALFEQISLSLHFDNHFSMWTWVSRFYWC